MSDTASRFFRGTLIFIAGLAAAAPLDVSQTQSFAVEKTAKVPGATLKAGTYSIGMLDSLSDRSILQVKDDQGKVKSTFIGIRRAAAPDGSQPGMNLWPQSKSPAYRAWVLPNGQGALEFAYPKADAVKLAKENQAPVPAIDPESEGKHPFPSLSKDDMTVVNLWLLAATEVNPKTHQTGIEAKHFVPDAERTQVAGNATPAAVQNVPAPQNSPVLVARAEPAPAAPGAIKKLPHSGSNLPLIGLGGILLLFAALALPKMQTRNTRD